MTASNLGRFSQRCILNVVLRIESKCNVKRSPILIVVRLQKKRNHDNTLKETLGIWGFGENVGASIRWFSNKKMLLPQFQFQKSVSLVCTLFFHTFIKIFCLLQHRFFRYSQKVHLIGAHAVKILTSPTQFKVDTALT